MDQIRAFLHDNLLGIIVGAVITALLALLWRITVRLLRFARTYGWRQLLNTGKDVILQVAAYEGIREDPVLTAGYLTNLVASLILNATYVIISFVVLLSGLAEPLWLRITAAVGVVFFWYRVGRRSLLINGLKCVLLMRRVFAASLMLLPFSQSSGAALAATASNSINPPDFATLIASCIRGSRALVVVGDAIIDPPLYEPLLAVLSQDTVELQRSLRVFEVCRKVIAPSIRLA
jgi:hypothetical protein